MRRDGFAPIESLLQRCRYLLTAKCQLLHLHRTQIRERLNMSARQHKRVARIPGMDVEKCHDEVAVEDQTGRELAGEDSTKGTWIHASPFWRTGREPTEESLVSQTHVLRTTVV